MPAVHNVCLASCAVVDASMAQEVQITLIATGFRAGSGAAKAGDLASQPAAGPRRAVPEFASGTKPAAAEEPATRRESGGFQVCLQLLLVCPTALSWHEKHAAMRLLLPRPSLHLWC